MLQNIILMLNTIAHDQGLNPVIAPGEHSGALTIGGFNINIGLLESRKIILFQAPIGIIPEQNQLKLFKKLLTANNLFIETSGATLGLDYNNGLITLQVAWPFENLTYSSLTDLIGNVILLTGEWIEKINKFIHEDNNCISSKEFDVQKMLAV